MKPDPFVIAPARWAAYRVLRDVHAGRADLPSGLARARDRLADERDRALAAEIATGTLRWQATLDHLAGRLVRRPLDQLDPEVLLVLRLGLYQLLHLERVPDRAVVDDAVEMVRRAGRPSAAGLVNAVLRAAVRQRGELPLPEPPRSPERARESALDFLSISLSHPRWLVARWMDRHGFEAARAWAAFNNAAAPLTLRANRLRNTPQELAAALDEYGVTTRPARYAPDGLVVMAGNPLRTPLADAGRFLVQDEASQLVALLAAARPGSALLDTCASPGGKTVAFAAMMHDRGLLVAADVRPRRMALLHRTVRLSGAQCVRLVQLDLRHTLPFQHPFDAVVLDVPCSGLGTIRRDPEIRWRRSEDALRVFAAAEEGMLERAAEGVRPGGELLYATCSSEPEENDQVVRGFLERHPKFALLDEGIAAARLPAIARPLLGEDGFFRTLPHRDGLEAFFAAPLRRAEGRPAHARWTTTL